MTFTIVGRDRKTNNVGVAMASAVPGVGGTVPHIELRLAAVAIQALTKPIQAATVIEYLKYGLDPETAIQRTIEGDKEREFRQILVVDALGRTSGFTGKKTTTWSGHAVGRGCIAGGNILAGKRVPRAMVQKFTSDAGTNLAERLLAALEAGQTAGGDRRGRQGSAALKVSQTVSDKVKRPLLDLHVDFHRNPVNELRLIYEEYSRIRWPTRGADYERN